MRQYIVTYFVTTDADPSALLDIASEHLESLHLHVEAIGSNCETVEDGDIAVEVAGHLESYRAAAARRRGAIIALLARHDVITAELRRHIQTTPTTES